MDLVVVYLRYLPDGSVMPGTVVDVEFMRRQTWIIMKSILDRSAGDPLNFTQDEQASWQRLEDQLMVLDARLRTLRE